MKFPLSANVFPSIRLTPEQCAEYEQLAATIVAETLGELDAFNHQQRRNVNTLQWKPVKKRDGITVYSERCVRGEPQRKRHDSTASTPTSVRSTLTPSSSYDFSRLSSFDRLGDDFTASGRSTMRFHAADIAVARTPTSSSASTPRRLPQLLAVGSVANATVEDMVFGLSSPTAAHTMIQAAYTDDDVLDAKVLYEITRPTPADPLRSLALKWVVRGHAHSISALVRRPRDLVFLESAGVQTRADGSRVGFLVVHSVDLYACRRLDEFSIVRARTSSCYLFTPRSDDNRSVDVFMKSYIELNGNVSDALAVRTAANTLLRVASAPQCSHRRKMGWDVTKRLRYPTHDAVVVPSGRDARSGSSSSNDKARGACVRCSSRFSHRRSARVSCYFCASIVCNKCAVEQTLTLPSSAAATPTARAGKIVVTAVLHACVRCCATRFRLQDAALVARQEILEGEYGSVTPSSPHPEECSSIDNVDTSSAKAHTILSRDAVPSFSYAHAHIESTVLKTPQTVFVVPRQSMRRNNIVKPTTSVETPTSSHKSLARTESVIELARDDGEWVRSSSPPTSSSSNSSHSNNSNNGDLYARITELHQTAEKLYQFTKRTTETVLSTSNVASTPLRRA